MRETEGRVRIEIKRKGERERDKGKMLLENCALLWREDGEEERWREFSCFRTSAESVEGVAPWKFRAPMAVVRQS